MYIHCTCTYQLGNEYNKLVMWWPVMFTSCEQPHFSNTTFVPLLSTKRWETILTICSKVGPYGVIMYHNWWSILTSMQWYMLYMYSVHVPQPMIHLTSNDHQNSMQKSHVNNIQCLNHHKMCPTATSIDVHFCTCTCTPYVHIYNVCTCCILL